MNPIITFIFGVLITLGIQHYTSTSEVYSPEAQAQVDAYLLRYEGGL